ncbi:trypsin-like serine peptidase [Bacillus pretiosus]|uniref:Serine protease n=1 Tax=Bacillus pretiosus TaxID=2983392 RepID=A0ABT3EQW5_9BACI|nr:serine protease [Bacillus pretiosus]MCW1239208.1 serine protease [Bacillus pretiosus]
MSTSNRDIRRHTHSENATGFLVEKPVKYVSPPETSTSNSINVELESVCSSEEEGEFQDVEKYDGTLGVTVDFVKNHQAAVGQVQWNDNLNEKYSSSGNVSGVRWGSGTLIANDLFLTAGHLFDSDPEGWIVPRIANTNNPISPEEIAINMKVNFNYQFDSTGQLHAEDSYKIIELVEYREGLDYAIVRLEREPGNKYGIAKISKEDAQVNDTLCIIQHPEGVPKKIEAGSVKLFSNEHIAYSTIDTEGGSSGSGILQSPNGLLVGVHTNGGCPQKHNYGVRISSLIQKSKTIQHLLNL